MSLALLDDSYQESLRQIYYHWYEYADVFTKMQDYAQELKKQGYKLFVLSNTAASYYDLAKKGYLPIDEILDGKILSYEVEMVKPDVAIYQYLLDKYGLEAQNCVFLDDIKGNIEAAQSLGMQGIQVISENQALADLKVLLSKYGRLSEQ
ncbi:HAD family phosphatase [Enterococcus cecorum]